MKTKKLNININRKIIYHDGMTKEKFMALLKLCPRASTGQQRLEVIKRIDIFNKTK